MVMNRKPSQDEMYNLAKRMGTVDLLQSLKKQQSDYTMNISNNDFEDDLAKMKEDEEKKKRRWCCGKKSRFRRYCTCFNIFYKNSDNENDLSFVSQEFSSGESEKEEDMVNYIDERKPYVPFR